MVNSPISIAFLVVLLIVIYFSIIRKHRSFKEYLPIFLFALSLAILQIIYIWLRTDEFTVTNSLMQYGLSDFALCMTGSFATTSSGLIIMKNASRTRGKITGLLLSVLPQLILTGFYAGFTTFINIMYLQREAISMTLWNYKSVLMVMMVPLGEMLPILLFDYLTRRKETAGNTSISG